MSEPIRIGTAEFLNAWPLTYGLDGRDGVTLRFGPPSALAAERGERARAGGATGFVALPLAAIGSRGTIGSVRLFGYAEPGGLRRVVLDPASHTSNALARIIVARRLGRRAHFVMPEDAAAATRPPDAEVVIGDRGLVARRPEAKWVLDLGEEWDRFVHLPFVYAFWVARADVPLGPLVELLSAARDSGLAARHELAGRAAGELGIPAETAGRYLMEQVRYEFSAKEQSGLRAFYRMAMEEGLAPEGVRLRMAGAGRGGP